MKWIVITSLFTALMAMQPAKKNKIIFFGDSITQMGTNEGGYISLLNESLEKKGTASRYDISGSGVGYNKVYDLYLRMEDDVLAKSPDKVFIWIGVNDVGHKTSGTGTDPDKFEKFYEAIIKKMQDKRIQLVLCTPAVIGERNDYTNQQDGDLNYYSIMIRNLAKKFNCGLLDFRKIFHDYEVAHNTDNKESGILTTDRIHLNKTGNKLVAEEIEKLL
ncbi:MAG: G-D-S-L family lipolytic protein [Chitinophagaceae bacterium]|nr:G-D-S-L family lipolytic protein [Chitinophagaceae bacterium]